VPPVQLAVSVTDWPLSIVFDAGETEHEGCGFTVTVADAVAVALVLSVAVTVYVVVLVGETVIDCVVAPPGDHEYVTAPMLFVHVVFSVTD